MTTPSTSFALPSDTSFATPPINIIAPEQAPPGPSRGPSIGAQIFGAIGRAIGSIDLDALLARIREGFLGPQDVIRLPGPTPPEDIIPPLATQLGTQFELPPILPRLPRTGSDIIRIPEDPNVTPDIIPEIPPTTETVFDPPIIPIPGGIPVAELADILRGAGNILGAFSGESPTGDFGGFGGTGSSTPFQIGTQIRGFLGLGGDGNGGGTCPPVRPRMPSSLQMADPCAPNNPTFYLKAGKASAAMWPNVLAGQARKLARANRAVPKKTVRRKKGR